MENISKLNEAFHNFTRASKSLESYYEKLDERVRYLTEELGRKNTQLKDAILKVGESKDYLQAVLQSIGEAIIVLDRDENVTMINRAAEELFSLKSNNVRGRLFDELEFSIDENSHGTVLLVGEKRYDVIFSRSTVLEAGGGLRGYVILIKDISRLKELEKQDERNSRLISMGEMAAKIVHEIRSPLCSIELYSTMLSKDLDHTPHAEMAHGISTGIKSLNNILTNMLFFAKPQKPSFKKLNIGSILEETVTMLRALIDVRGIDLYVETLDEEINGDSELLKQVFMNIILNAVQSMPDGGKMTISVQKEDGMVKVSVMDEGEGIDKKNIEKIFDPFYSTKDNGTGLGLAIAHKIVMSHEGFIKAAKNDLKGSTFSLYFPKLEGIDRKETGKTLCLQNR